MFINKVTNYISIISSLPRNIAEDLSQDFIVTLLEKGKPLSLENNKTILKNKINDFFRKQAQEKKCFEDTKDSGSIKDSSTLSPEEHLKVKESLSNLIDEIYSFSSERSLNKKSIYSVILQELYLFNNSTKDVADFLNINHNTVRQIKSRFEEWRSSNKN